MGKCQGSVDPEDNRLPDYGNDYPPGEGGTVSPPGSGDPVGPNLPRNLKGILRIRINGLGDVIKVITSLFGIKGCVPCEKRAARLNQIMPIPLNRERHVSNYTK